MFEAFLAVPLFLLSAVITAIVLRLAARAQLIAVPGDRSSHSAPTPVGGGLAIVATYLLGLLMLYRAEFVTVSEFVALAASLVVAIIGLMDDRRHVDFRLRLAVQFAAVFAALVAIGNVPHAAMFDCISDSLIIVWILFALMLLWMTNLYNFMDGIDGFAGIQACFVGLAAAGLLGYAGDYGLALLCLFLASGAAGFLVWNWPPARIFMGDVGSGFVGFTFGVIAILSFVHESMSLWSWVLLMGCFIVDATLTLLKRVASGERWYQAHCSHAYQNAARRFASHKRVTVGLLLINVIWLLPVVVLTTIHPEYGVYLATIGLIPLGILALWLGAGKVSG
jgi:Fuc2NAc and GlcNAc transferase